jgi:hypothetical protein
MVSKIMDKKNILILSTKIIATFFLFFYVNKTINFTQISQVRNLDKIFFIAVTFGFIQQFLLFCRWYFAVKTAGISTGIKSIFESYFIGQFLGTISPARSGETAKIFYLQSASKKRGIFAVSLDAIVALLTLFIVGLWKNYPQSADKTILFINKILNVAGITDIVIITGITIFVICSRTVKSKTNIAKLFSISLLQNVVLVIEGALIFNILLPISFLEASFVVTSAYCIIPFIPLTIAAIGVREFAFSLLISAFVESDIAKPVVFAVSYIFLLCNSAVFMLPGIWLFYKKKYVE